MKDGIHLFRYYILAEVTLNAQGIYPLPCYLMYDPHMKSMVKPDEFATKVLMPRLRST